MLIEKYITTIHNNNTNSKYIICWINEGEHRGM